MRRLGEALFVIGIGYLVFASTGSPWFPWDALAAAACVGTGFRLGRFRHRWQAHAPVRDEQHEIVVGVDKHEDRQPQ